MLELLTSSPWAMGAAAYSVGLWAVFLWILVDSRRRGSPRSLLRALGLAMIFPVGVFLYRSGRDWD